MKPATSDIILLWIGFALNLMIMAFNIKIWNKLGKSGHYSIVVTLIGFTSFLFTIHHIIEIVAIGNSFELIVSEVVEVLTGILFGYAMYQLYSITST